jgi:hypothetical protein
MPSVAVESVVSGPSHPVAIAMMRRRKRMILILSAVAALGVCLALSAGKLAGPSIENFRFYRACGWLVAGFCIAVWFPLASYMYARNARTVNQMANSPDVLARWTYTVDEQAAFVTRERERVRMNRKDVMALAIVFAVMGALVWVAGRIFYGWDTHVIPGVMIGAAIFFGILIVSMYIVNRNTLAALPEQFAGEVIIGSHGLLTAKQLSRWGTREERLIGAAFTPGEPGELSLKIRKIQQTQEGQSEFIENLHVPVPKGHDEEAQDLVAALLGGG